MDVLDARESGYTRVEVTLDFVTLLSPSAAAPSTDGETVGILAATFAAAPSSDTAALADGACCKGVGAGTVLGAGTPVFRLWTYVPNASQCASPTEEYPIVQTYLDVVLEGCLAEGGEKMASTFILTTTDWSAFFLNDVHTSRRPWLHRKKYQEIDGLFSCFRVLFGVCCMIVGGV
jgi:hypothetical protein